MQKEWSSFRITLLLYIIVLILPFSFYFVYASFKTMQQDTKIVRQSSWLSGSMNHLSVDPSNKSNQQTIKDIDKTLNEISLWAKKNNDSKLYIGTESLSKDFSKVNTCWNSYKDAISSPNATPCYDLTENLALIIEKMVYLKQNKLINMFYLSLTLAMILLLLVIYFVRIYIHKQMKKHAIHDHETKLFNKKYFLSQLKTSCARSVRYKYPLSMASLHIANFGKEDHSYDKKTKEQMLRMFGGLINSIVRESDVACRYEDGQFFILLPDTEEKGAMVLKERILKTIESHDFGVTPKPEFEVAVTHFDQKETAEAFIERIL